jgi:hypothetical protein
VLHTFFANAQAFGAPEVVIIDISRMENGQAAEHWDVVQLPRDRDGQGDESAGGARDPEAGTVRALAAETGSWTVRPPDAVASADVVVCTLPWSAVGAALSDLGDPSGETVIDCTNLPDRLDGGFGRTLGHTTRGGEVLQRPLTAARVVKAMNQVGAEVMARNTHLPQRLVMAAVFGFREAACSPALRLPAVLPSWAQAVLAAPGSMISTPEKTSRATLWMIRAMRGAASSALPARVTSPAERRILGPSSDTTFTSLSFSAISDRM